MVKKKSSKNDREDDDNLKQRSVQLCSSFTTQARVNLTLLLQLPSVSNPGVSEHFHGWQNLRSLAANNSYYTLKSKQSSPCYASEAVLLPGILAHPLLLPLLIQREHYGQVVHTGNRCSRQPQPHKS